MSDLVDRELESKTTTGEDIYFVGHVHKPNSNEGGGGGRRNGGRSCQCGCVARMAFGSHIAQRMRKAIFDQVSRGSGGRLGTRAHPGYSHRFSSLPFPLQLGFTSCAGISNNKMLAKLAGEIKKPNAQSTLLPVRSEITMHALCMTDTG